MPMSRKAAERFADAFSLDIEHNRETGKVRGKKIVDIKIAKNCKIQFDWKIVADFGDHRLKGADAGIALRGPGFIGAIMARVQDVLEFVLLDVRKLRYEDPEKTIELDDWIQDHINDFDGRSNPVETDYLEFDYFLGSASEAIVGHWVQDHKGWKAIGAPLRTS